MRFILLSIKENIKELLYFIRNIPGYFRLQINYGCDPDIYSYIIENYEKVLCNRTKTMSKPTYHWKDVVYELDRWYEEWREEETEEMLKDIHILIGNWFLALEDECCDPWDISKCISIAKKYNYTMKDYKEFLKTIY